MLSPAVAAKKNAELAAQLQMSLQPATINAAAGRGDHDHASKQGFKDLTNKAQGLQERVLKPLVRLHLQVYRSWEGAPDPFKT